MHSSRDEAAPLEMETTLLHSLHLVTKDPERWFPEIAAETKLDRQPFVMLTIAYEGQPPTAQQCSSMTSATWWFLLSVFPRPRDWPAQLRARGAAAPAKQTRPGA